MISDKIKGVIFGQAIGDALGVRSEFMSKEMVGNTYGVLSDYCSTDKPFDDIGGQWSDDTEMMLCIARAMIKDKCVNPLSVAKNFKEWLLSGNCYGIGNSTYSVLKKDEYVDNPFYESESFWIKSNRRNAANGGIMRTAIIGLLKDDVISAAEQVCKLTHYDPRCVGSSVAISEVVSRLIWQNEQMSPVDLIRLVNHYDPRIAEYVALSQSKDISVMQLDDEYTMGYTLKTMGAALWCLYNAKDFQDGLLVTVNEGGDADTNAAVACALLGAKYGYSAIPLKYIDGLSRKNELMSISDKLIDSFAKGK